MASAHKVGSKISTSNWRKNFPTNVLESSNKSCLLVKKLLAFGVSNILYLRTPLDETDFRSTDLEGIPLKLLNDSSPNEITRQICSWILGASKAIDKGYLRDLILAFYNNGSTAAQAFETHTFHFEYNEAGSVAVSFGECNLIMTTLERENDLFEQTFYMLKKTIQVAQSMEELPKDTQVTIKLTYYDERTPADYEPPGFTSTDVSFQIDEEEPSINAGHLKSSYHKLSLDVRSKFFKEPVAKMLSQATQ